MPTTRRSSCLILAIAVLLVACGPQQPPADEPTSRPVKTFIVGGAEFDGKRSFPGRVDATYSADLAFRVPGTVQEIVVREGDLVEPGQLLASLDPTDYRITVQDRVATFENSRRNFERASELVADGFISRIEFDRLEANFKSSEAALAAAQQDLAYTELKAPFGGRAAKRHVERFEEVAAKQTVFTLQDTDTLEIKIDVPETLVRRLRAHRDQRPGDAAPPAVAAFEGHANRNFPLTFREVSTRADPKTQTFEVTFNMDAPEDLIVLPGMTATVTIDLAGRVDRGDEAIWVPLNAVVADSDLGARVYVLDAQSMTVGSVPVEIGRMQGGQVEVLSGLSGGEEIVSVGAPYLSEGMAVTRMTTTEQAVPRPGDPG